MPQKPTKRHHDDGGEDVSSSSSASHNGNSKIVAVDVAEGSSSTAAPVKKSASKSTSGKTSASSSSSQQLVSARKFGTVFVVGQGDAGQLGLGPVIMHRKKPSPLKAIEGIEISQIAAGGMHNVAISSDGKVWSWGCNDEGALGRNGEETIPALVEGIISKVKIVQAACGDSHTNVLSDKGVVYGWGTYRDSGGRMGLDIDTAFKEGLHDKHTIQFEPKVVLDLKSKRDSVIKIAASNNHTIAVTEQGHIYTWGCGEHGQLGRVGSKSSERWKFTTVLTPTDVNVRCMKGHKAVNVFTGGYQSFVLYENDQVVAFGLNNYFQCGIEIKNEPLLRPEVVTALSGRGVVDIKGGEHHTLALLKDGTVLSFGRGEYGRLGHGGDEEVSTPKPISALSLSDQSDVIQQIAAGSIVSFALSKKGNVYAWGMGNNYQLAMGNEDDVELPTLIPTVKFNENRVLAVSSGGQHTLFLVDYVNKIIAAPSAAPSAAASVVSTPAP